MASIPYFGQLLFGKHLLSGTSEGSRSRCAGQCSCPELAVSVTALSVVLMQQLVLQRCKVTMYVDDVVGIDQKSAANRSVRMHIMLLTNHTAVHVLLR